MTHILNLLPTRLKEAASVVATRAASVSGQTLSASASTVERSEAADVAQGPQASPRHVTRGER